MGTSLEIFLVTAKDRCCSFGERDRLRLGALPARDRLAGLRAGEDAPGCRGPGAEPDVRVADVERGAGTFREAVEGFRSCLAGEVGVEESVVGQAAAGAEVATQPVDRNVDGWIVEGHFAVKAFGEGVAGR